MVFENLEHRAIAIEKEKHKQNISDDSDEIQLYELSKTLIENLDNIDLTDRNALKKLNPLWQDFINTFHNVNIGIDKGEAAKTISADKVETEQTYSLLTDSESREGFSLSDDNIEKFSFLYHDVIKRIEGQKKKKLIDEKNKEPESIVLYLLYQNFMKFSKKEQQESSIDTAPYKLYQKFSKVIYDFFTIFYRNLSTKAFFKLSILVTTIVVSFISLMITFESISTKGNSISTIEHLFALSFIGVMCFLLFLFTWKPNFVWWVASLFTLFFIVTCLLLSVFNSDLYASFLRKIRFGGGIAVTLEERTDDQTANKSVSGYLLLKTESSYFLYLDNEQAVMEIPSIKISNVFYSLSSDYKLP